MKRTEVVHGSNESLQHGHSMPMKKCTRLLWGTFHLRRLFSKTSMWIPRQIPHTKMCIFFTSEFVLAPAGSKYFTLPRSPCNRAKKTDWNWNALALAITQVPDRLQRAIFSAIRHGRPSQFQTSTLDKVLVRVYERMRPSSGGIIPFGI